MGHRTILSAVTLYDGIRPRQFDMSVVIEDGRIAAVVPPGTDPGPGRRVDLAGRTLMPGMTVGHWHGEFDNIGPPLFTGGPRAGTFIGTEKPPALLALQAAQSLEHALASGVLRVVSASCSNNLDVQMQMAMRDGLLTGADLTACSRHVLGTAEQEDRGQWWNSMAPVRDGVRRVGGNVFVDGVDQVVKAVRQEILFGAEIIKTYVDGGHGLDWTPTYQAISRDELQAIVDTAHERDVRVRAHVTNADTILTCIELGVDILDHCDFIDERCIEAMVRHGTVFVPSPIFGKLASAAGRGETPNLDDPADRGWLNLQKMLPLANQAGVTIVPGDDYGAMGMLHAPGVYGRELQIYADDFGIPVTDVLRWATVNGAQLAGVADDSGSIEAGKSADFLVLDGDPVENTALFTDPARHLRAIVRRGQVLKNDLCADFALA
jgi:imidazolonepropionase-like amidohydrolase